MILLMLQSEPSRRPTIHKLAQNDFLTKGKIPSALPITCLTMAPRFDNVEQQTSRKVLSEIQLPSKW